MISLYDWRERGQVWPSKNKRAPDGEKDRAGAAAGLASVTASGLLSKILFSWVSPLWKSLEEELTGWGHSRKETQSVQRHFMTCMVEQLHSWDLGKDWPDQRVGLWTWTVKAAQMASQGSFIYWVVGQAGSQEWNKTYVQKTSLAMLAHPFFLHLSHHKLVEVEEGCIVSSKYQFTEYKWIRWEVCEMPYK